MEIIAPSRRLLDETRATLEDALPPGGGEIVRRLGLSSYLECATVAACERAAGRLIVPEDIADRVMELVSRLGASCRRAGFRMLHLPSPVEGTDHHGSFVPEDVAGSRPLLYLGITPDFARGAEIAELGGDHAVLGGLFGYPTCCVDAFRASASSTFDRLPATIPSTGPFPFAMNPVVPHLYGISFLFHFPCTPACEASLDLLHRRQRFLAKLAPPAAAFCGLAAGIALYGPEVGIGLITRYEELEPGVFRALAVLTRSDRTRSLFSGAESPLVRLYNPHSFTIGRRRFDGPDQFAAVFA
jgi:hypothetical protein